MFFDSIGIGTRICSFCIDMNLWIFVLVLVAGRFFEKDFLLSVSQVLLRVILFREDIGSISCVSKSCDSHSLAFIEMYFIIIFLLHSFLFLIRKLWVVIFRTVIEPFLYKLCVCVQYVYTSYPFGEEKNRLMLCGKMEKKNFPRRRSLSEHYILCICMIFRFYEGIFRIE